MRLTQFTGINEFCQKAIAILEFIGLIVIAGATAVAMVHEILVMVGNETVTLTDLLLMFLYLEVLAMVSYYFRSGKLPVRFPLYIAMVALARYLILDLKQLTEWRMLAASMSILLITIAVLIVRYGHVRFPYMGDAIKTDTDSTPE